MKEEYRLPHITSSTALTYHREKRSPSKKRSSDIVRYSFFIKCYPIEVTFESHGWGSCDAWHSSDFRPTKTASSRPA